MGDRALVIFTGSDDEISPTVYLHWNGNGVPKLLSSLKDYMCGREDDVSYAAARFAGIAHQAITGNLSLGISNTEPEIAEAVRQLKESHNATRKAAEAVLSEASHGDAGLIVVNCEDFTWQAFGGYLAKEAA